MNQQILFLLINGFKLGRPARNGFKERGLLPDPTIEQQRRLIPVNKEHQFLSIIPNAKLSFIPHIKNLKAKCLKKTMNILKILSYTNWGSDRKCLFKLYRSLARSRLDYVIVYRASMPMQSLYVELNEWSLHLQR